MIQILTFKSSEIKKEITESRINNRTIKQSSNNPLNKPGIIEINKFDEQYKFISTDAINWLKNLHSMD